MKSKMPFGTREPNNEEKKLLSLIGIDVTNVEKNGTFYYLTLPSENDSYLRYIRYEWHYNKVQHLLFYGDFRVFTGSQSNEAYTTKIYPNIHKAEIEKALSADPQTFTWEQYKKILEDANKDKKAEFAQQKNTEQRNSVVNGILSVISENSANINSVCNIS